MRSQELKQREKEMSGGGKGEQRARQLAIDRRSELVRLSCARDWWITVMDLVLEMGTGKANWMKLLKGGH